MNKPIAADPAPRIVTTDPIWSAMLQINAAGWQVDVSAVPDLEPHLRCRVVLSRRRPEDLITLYGSTPFETLTKAAQSLAQRAAA